MNYFCYYGYFSLKLIWYKYILIVEVSYVIFWEIWILGIIGRVIINVKRSVLVKNIYN